MSSTFSYAGNGANGTSTSERIAGSVLRTLDRVATKAGGVEHDVRRRVAALRAEAREQEQRARALVSANIDKTLAYTREKPLVAMGIACAAGAVIYGLLRRR
jgi:ElaB/YqjD/DUF883 family membrane-anchored ribosome-binding protein